jgi:hypothetical protein
MAKTKVNFANGKRLSNSNLKRPETGLDHQYVSLSTGEN